MVAGLKLRRPTPNGLWEINNTNYNILSKQKPDYLILFSWHIKNELKKNLKKKGFKGKFIIPLPEVRVVGKEILNKN